MGYTISEKIIKAHLMNGNMTKGSEISIKIDQTLTQDATGTMAYLEFESMNIDRVKTECSVAYIDHNTLQTGFENADDHKFIQSMAEKYGIYYSRPGNGICHQVHLERFAVPGKTLIGSDSHTPTAGAMGMLSVGAGGLDVAVAMGGGAYYILMPEMVKINLSGKLKPFVSAKDIILKVLQILKVNGGIGKIIEYGGDGIKYLSIPERSTITNMGAELGATTSIFPSDNVTLEFLKSQNRENDWTEILPDDDACYNEIININLDTLSSLAACPNSPDNVKSVDEIGKIKVDQICIGSCTNSSYLDLMKVARILKGKTIHPNVSLSISPGSKQVYSMLAQNGALSDLINAGARILECACGPCIGMGQSPNSNGVSLRTFNRNFEGRSGTANGKIYLVSPETAAASAIYGVLTNPKSLGPIKNIDIPANLFINDNMIIKPININDAKNIEILRGPNIKPFPVSNPLDETIKSKALLKVGDNITTDHIMPAGTKILPFRSNIPYLSQFCFANCNKDFQSRCKKEGTGIIIAGHNYGQGSSREHAALVPLYLGIKVVIAKSFARIHRANLVNVGILPLIFESESDYDNINQMDTLLIKDIKSNILTNNIFIVENLNSSKIIKVKLDISNRQKNIILAGGLLNYTKENQK